MKGASMKFHVNMMSILKKPKLSLSSISIPRLILLPTLVFLALNIFPRLNHPFWLPPPPLVVASTLSSSSSSISSHFSPPLHPLVVSTAPSQPFQSQFSIGTLPQRLTAKPAPPPSWPPLQPSPPPTLVTPSPPLPSPPVPRPQQPPPPPVSLPSSTISTGTQPIQRLARDCDITRGEWIWDPKAPYYTNMTCSTIQEHQNCMKYGRPDTDFLKWRWKPEGCDLPLFDPYRFLELLRGKSLAFVGDSLARNQVQSLMCLLSRVEDPKDITKSKDGNPKRMFYTSYNFTISIFWSPFLVKAQEGKKGPFGSIFWDIHLDVADKTWASRIDQFDYLIISGGNWFNRPSMLYRRRRRVGCLYCNVDSITHMSMQYSNRMAFRTALRAINKKSSFKGMVILRTLSPSHFENGDWDRGGNCVRTRPFRSNHTRMEGKERELYKNQMEEFRKAEKEGRKRGLEFRLIDTTGAMLLRPDGHPSRYGHWPDDKVALYNDCVHWCLPGPVDTMNDFLLHLLSKEGGEKSTAT